MLSLGHPAFRCRTWRFHRTLERKHSWVLFVGRAAMAGNASGKKVVGRGKLDTCKLQSNPPARGSVAVSHTALPREIPSRQSNGFGPTVAGIGSAVAPTWRLPSEIKKRRLGNGCRESCSVTWVSASLAVSSALSACACFRRSSRAFACLGFLDSRSKKVGIEPPVAPSPAASPLDSL